MDYFRDFFANLAQSWTGWLSIWLPLWAISLINYVIIGLVLVMMPVIATLTLTWMERKVVGRIQNRIGPNRVGPWGIFQALADAVKMLIKEDIVPTGADKPVFNLAPILIFFAAALLWAVIPFGPKQVAADLNIAVLYIIAVGSITTIAVLMAGFSSDNKYALVGAFRSVAQLLSYEIPMVLSIAAVTLLVGSMRMRTIVESQTVAFALVLPAAFIVYMLSAIAETGRSPFDLLEAESEIVAGFFIEYSGLKFGWFYIAEYGNTLAVAAIATTLFLGGWRGPWVSEVPVLGPVYFALKTIAIVFVVMWIRGTWPRFRIDQMLGLAWKVLVPVSLLNLLWVAVVLKLPVPVPVQWILALGGNLAVLAGALTVLGRRSRHNDAGHGNRSGNSQEGVLHAEPSRSA
jgi:NADH-quinone oxidoreductase subunit H